MKQLEDIMVDPFGSIYLNMLDQLETIKTVCPKPERIDKTQKNLKETDKELGYYVCRIINNLIISEYEQVANQSELSNIETLQGER